MKLSTDFPKGWVKSENVRGMPESIASSYNMTSHNNGKLRAVHYYFRTNEIVVCYLCMGDLQHHHWQWSTDLKIWLQVG